MYKHILVPTDGSPLSLKAARSATQLAAALGARLTAVYVSPTWMPTNMSEAALQRHVDQLRGTYEKAAAANAEQALSKVSAIAKSEGVRCGTLHVTDQQPAEGIIGAVKSEKCDLVVMSSHARTGLSRVLLGSETTKVLAHSKIPVLVCR